MPSGKFSECESGEAWCCECKKCLPEENFTNSQHRKNGKNSRCKDCDRIYTRERRKIKND